MEGVLAVDVGVLLVERREGFRLRARFLAHLLDPLTREQQVRRIHVPGLHEPAGFLGAPAGVCAVHQSALVVHEVVQLAAGPGGALAEIHAADLQELGPGGIGDLENLAEDVDQALLA
jgi:hypothetical protein